MKTYSKTLIFVLLSTLVMCACSDDYGSSLWINKDNQNANPSIIPYATNLEIPKLDSENGDFYTHETNYNGKTILNFTLEWNPEKKHSRWVAFTFTSTNAQQNWNRNNWKYTEWKGDPFQPDPYIPTSERTELSDYSGDGYDRGHLCASADRLFSKDANEQTFYLSNMSPQISQFNQNDWTDLEALVQNWGRNSNFRDTLFVVKGGTIRDDQILKYTKHNVAVPKYYFMALLCKKKINGSNTYKAIGFWVEHKSYGGSPDVSSWAVSIDDLEKKTGIDFFCNLPDRIEIPVEKAFSLESWPGLK